MKVIIFETDAGLSVLRPTREWRAKFETEDEALAACLLKDVPEGSLSAKIVDESELPTDRSNRDSWSIKDGKIAVR